MYDDLIDADDRPGAPAPPGLDELASALRGTLDTLDGFIDYYEIPRNHPDAHLIASEAAAARDLLRRLESARTTS